MRIRDAAWFQSLAPLAFSGTYAGYRPNVVESPHGDGRLDTGKRYAHLAPKYFDADTQPQLQVAFFVAYCDALRAAKDYGLPMRLWPQYEACALRLLEYPSGEGSAGHTDFDLFTLNLWRSDPTPLRQEQRTPPGIHFGELWPLLVSESTPATYHWVEPDVLPQRAAVFFALPAHDVELPDGRTVGEWLTERLARSRSVV